ncbi:MAG: RNA 2',3'-cyclic phosphodiesterase [Clostridia bacterium]|nr:RNA 2',3'-cyclic phosphodiesterase [Clostridia bacterium]
MRLFIAIEFPEDVKNALQSAVNAGSVCFARANFSRRENYHLTLVFLGETAPVRVKDITSAMDACAFPPFEMTVGGAGRFRRDGGDTVWRRVDAPDALFDTQKKLERELAARGFRLESRAFTPHITLAREAVTAAGVDFSKIDLGSPLTFAVSGMTLMRSDRINGKLTYTPIYRTK